MGNLLGYGFNVVLSHVLAAGEFGELGVDINVAGLGASRDRLISAGQEVGDLVDGSLEVGLAEGGRQLDVQHLPRATGAL